jgi:hypothetical protein
VPGRAAAFVMPPIDEDMLKHGYPKPENSDDYDKYVRDKEMVDSYRLVEDTPLYVRGEPVDYPRLLAALPLALAKFLCVNPLFWVALMAFLSYGLSLASEMALTRSSVPIHPEFYTRCETHVSEGQTCLIPTAYLYNATFGPYVVTLPSLGAYVAQYYRYFRYQLSEHAYHLSQDGSPYLPLLVTWIYSKLVEYAFGSFVSLESSFSWRIWFLVFSPFALAFLASCALIVIVHFTPDTEEPDTFGGIANVIAIEARLSVMDLLQVIRSFFGYRTVRHFMRYDRGYKLIVCRPVSFALARTMSLSLPQASGGYNKSTAFSSRFINDNKDKWFVKSGYLSAAVIADSAIFASQQARVTGINSTVFSPTDGTAPVTEE